MADEPAAPDPAEIARAVWAVPPRCGAVRLICIDGPAGAGKSTLAEVLSGLLDAAPIVHLDDLYEGWEQPLGTVLADRVEAWLLLAWEAGLPGQHLKYDWLLGRYEQWVVVPPAPVVIVEGCGSGSAGIRSRASIVIWVEAAQDVRLARGLSRDGAEMAQLWGEWQAAEAMHFAADGTRAAADVVVDGTGQAP